ncbi:MAG: DNA primase [Planctomycetota bacterium]|jgi:DNA primase|nr:DNA primase [Planctomycetota bacterium]
MADGSIGEEQIRQVKEAVDLVQLIGEYTPVQRSGVNFKACCPFHGERTPSFYIYTEDQHYHCYGCATHGDAISFVRDKENLEFVEAMEFLARRAGIELNYQQDPDARQRRSHRERLLAIHEWVCAYYERCLWQGDDGAEARLYLQDRGLTEETCRRFRLGWAPGRGRLIEAAFQERIDGQLLAELDLALERNGRLTDRFFERLMFPICDRFGQPIAFSGRLLPAAEAAAKEAGRGVGKYVNSTDTPLYSKGKVVFNLHRARGFCREAGRLLVMEGPTDVMAADQAGMGECTAVLGTALTPEHGRQLGNAIVGRGNLLLLFDGDRAGQTNSLKAVRTCLAVGVPTRVAVMPEGQDPAELLHGASADSFEQILDTARPDVPHLLQTLAPRPHTLDQRERLDVVDKIMECLRPVSDRDLRDGYIDESARYLGVDALRLHRRLSESMDPVYGSPPPEEEAGPYIEPLPELERAQETVLHLVIRHAELRSIAFDELGLEPVAFPEPWRGLIETLVVRPDADLDALLVADAVQAEPRLREACYRFVREPSTRHHVDLSIEPDRILRESTAAMRERDGFDEGQLLQALNQAQQDGDFVRCEQLFKDLAELRSSRRDQAGR